MKNLTFEILEKTPAIRFESSVITGKEIPHRLLIILQHSIRIIRKVLASEILFESDGDDFRLRADTHRRSPRTDTARRV